MIVKRFDALQSISGDNLLKCRISRTGIQTYILDDGSISREYRSPEEVFSKESMDSFELRPLTMDHPAAGLVTPQTAGILTHGTVGNVHRDSDNPEWLSANVRVVSDAAKEAVAQGKVQLSCGYLAQRIPVAPGTVHDSEGKVVVCDAVLKNIRGNHIALCDAARAGPGARILLDSFANIGIEVIQDTVEERDGKWVVLSLKGEVLGTFPSKEQAQKRLQEIEFFKHKKDEMDQTPVTEVKPEVAPVTQPVPEVKPEVNPLQGKLDSLAAELAKVTSPTYLHGLVSALRVALDVAAAHQIKTDSSMSTAQIEAMVVKHVSPTLKLDSFNPNQLHDLFTALPPTHVVREDTVTLVAPQDVLVAARSAQRKNFGLPQ